MTHDESSESSSALFPTHRIYFHLFSTNDASTAARFGIRLLLLLVHVLGRLDGLLGTGQIIGRHLDGADGLLLGRGGSLLDGRGQRLLLGGLLLLELGDGAGEFELGRLFGGGGTGSAGGGVRHGLLDELGDSPFVHLPIGMVLGYLGGNGLDQGRDGRRCCLGLVGLQGKGGSTHMHRVRRWWHIRIQQ